MKCINSERSEHIVKDRGLEYLLNFKIILILYQICVHLSIKLKLYFSLSKYEMHQHKFFLFKISNLFPTTEIGVISS